MALPKTIGVIGGVSPESTVEYYKRIISQHIERHGNHAYPEIVIFSVSFEQYIQWSQQECWNLIAEGLIGVARRLEAAGCDFLIITANTMHLVYRQVQEAIGVPILSMLDVVADAVAARGLKTVALLGTKYTMEAPLYPSPLAKRGIEVVIPKAADREFVNRVIYDELVKGEIREESRRGYVEVIGRLAERGAQGIILGCTEIPLLIGARDTDLPLFDTALLHADAAYERASD